jgi:hypothetical protein
MRSLLYTGSPCEWFMNKWYRVDPIHGEMQANMWM